MTPKFLLNSWLGQHSINLNGKSDVLLWVAYDFGFRIQILRCYSSPKGNYPGKMST